MKHEILLSVTILSAQQSKQTQDIGCSHLVTARTMKMLKVAKVANTFSNIYIRVFLHTYIKLAKVIETTFATFASPLSQLLLMGVRKKFEKSCLKIWRGWGQSCIFAARTSYGSEEGGASKSPCL